MKRSNTLAYRVARLEKLVREKSASRSHAPSKAFLVWKFLADRNGATRETIKDSFPESEQSSISGVLLDCLEEGIITQVRDAYFANKSYQWDDIGIFDMADKKDILDDLQYLTDRIK